VADDEKAIRRGRNSSAEIAAKTGPLLMGGDEAGANPAPRGGRLGDHLGDRPEKRRLPSRS
jgi:hypothetical protein